jgi:signal transduction histidine kinase
MIESGKLTMSQESMSLTDVLRDCQAMIEPQAQKRGVGMTFPQLDNLFFIHADRTRVKQIMINLLSNAIKYNRAGGAVIVQCEKSAENRVRVSVTDTGPGLTPEQLAQLFQPFNRLGQETGTEEGTGIGLVVTKQLVELMGGVIGVESRVGVGSVFWVDLAAASAPKLEFGNGEAGPDGRECFAFPAHTALCRRQSGKSGAGRAVGCAARRFETVVGYRWLSGHPAGTRLPAGRNFNGY